MNEFFADTVDLWSFNLLNTKFELIIPNSQNQFWRDFFKDLECGKDYETCRIDLTNKISNNFETFNQYSEGRYISLTLEMLENNSEFISILREIRINKVIV